MTAGAAFGVAPVVPRIDPGAVADHIAGVIAAIAPHDSQARFEGLGVRVIRAHGRFTAPDRVEAGGQMIRARRFVIATGSRPAVPEVPGLAGVPFLTNETVFALRETPEHLVVMGGGPIGLELAQAHRRLGARVTVIEGGRALGHEDRELAALVLARLRAEGVEIVESEKVASVSGGPGAVTVETAAGRRVEGSHLLVAAGRRVALEGLGLEAAGVEHDARGVRVGPGLRSVSNRRVHAAGDAAGGLQFTHVASWHAGIVLRAALFGLPARARDGLIPRATYTDPELAQVGLTEEEARAAHGPRLQVFRVPLAENDRARAGRQTGGMVKLMVAGGRPVGVGIAAPHAGELIALWALVLQRRIPLRAVAGMVLPYPTLAEAGKRAAGACLSPRLFANPWVGRIVRLVQRLP